MHPDPNAEKQKLFDKVLKYTKDVLSDHTVSDADSDKLVLSTFDLVLILRLERKDRSKELSAWRRQRRQTAEGFLKCIDQIKKDWVFFEYLRIKPEDLAKARIYAEDIFELLRIEGRASHRKVVHDSFLTVFHLLNRLGFSKGNARKFVYDLLSGFGCEDYGQNYLDSADRIIGKPEQLDRLRHIQKDVQKVHPIVAEIYFVTLLDTYQADLTNEKDYERQYKKAYIEQKAQWKKQLEEG